MQSHQKLMIKNFAKHFLVTEENNYVPSVFLFSYFKMYYYSEKNHGSILSFIKELKKHLGKTRTILAFVDGRYSRCILGIKLINLDKLSNFQLKKQSKYLQGIH